MWITVYCSKHKINHHLLFLLCLFSQLLRVGHFSPQLTLKSHILALHLQQPSSCNFLSYLTTVFIIPYSFTNHTVSVSSHFKIIFLTHLILFSLAFRLLTFETPILHLYINFLFRPCISVLIRTLISMTTNQILLLLYTVKFLDRYN